MAEESMDLSGAVDMLKEMLAGEEGQQTIQNILGMFGNEPPEETAPGVTTGGIDPDNIAMMMRLQKAMMAMNSRRNNNQTQLLTALKPFLKPSRRDKVDRAMQMLNLGQVIAVMKETQEDG